MGNIGSHVDITSGFVLAFRKFTGMLAKVSQAKTDDERVGRIVKVRKTGNEFSFEICLGCIERFYCESVR
jgi:hypothetical protein